MAHVCWHCYRENDKRWREESDAYEELRKRQKNDQHYLDTCAEATARFRARHPERVKEQYNRWYNKHGAKYAKVWQTVHRQDGAVRAQEALQNSLGAMLRSVRDGQPRESSKLLMFGVKSMNELLGHLWDIRETGMDWSNYGRPEGLRDRTGWVIDHIIPKKSYDLNDPEDMARCWCYLNLRPCWDIPNSEKSCSEPCPKLLARVPDSCYPKAGLRSTVGDAK